MALYLLTDEGAAAYLDLAAYVKIGTRNDVVPNYAFQAGQDVSNVQPFDFSGAVDPQSRSAYTAPELICMQYIYDFRNAAFPHNAWTTVFAAAPVSGVLRIVSDNANSVVGDLRIDGVESLAVIPAAPATDTIRVVNAYPINVVAGQLIEARITDVAGSSIVNAGINPFVYP
jgi:hypothetical protein